jgi:integrase
MKIKRRSLPLFVQVERTRHGKLVFYFRKNAGKRMRLPDTFPSEEFTHAYQACLVATADRKWVPPVSREGSLNWLVEKWRQSSDWQQTSAATKRQRENILTPILARNGELPFAKLNAGHIRTGKEERSKTPFAANNFLKTMRALFRWAKEFGLVDKNPAAEVKFMSSKTDGFEPWTAEEVAQFRSRHPLGTRPRIAFEVIVNTGLRRGDAVRLGRQHIKDGWITMRMEKTDTELAIPMLHELREAIEKGPVGDLAIICSSEGRPYSKESFGNLFRDWCREAGIEKSAHGLRKLAASQAAEAGATEEELQAWFGWQTIGQSSIYTKAASQKIKAQHLAEKLKLKRNKNTRTLDADIPSPIEKKG